MLCNSAPIDSITHYYASTIHLVGLNIISWFFMWVEGY